jgi:hypothetical protein
MAQRRVDDNWFSLLGILSVTEIGLAGELQTVPERPG